MRYFTASASTVRLTGGSPSAIQNTGDPFTLNCWCYAHDYSTSGLLTKWGGTNQWYLARNAAGRLEGAVDSGSGGVSITGVGIVRPWAWYMCTFARLGSGAGASKLYLNGVLDFQGTLGVSTHLSTDAFAIGGMTTLPFKGYIADAAIWRKQLTPEEIYSLYVGVSPRNIAKGSLFGYWPLLGDGGSEKDFSDQGTVLTVNAGAIPGLADTRTFLKANQGRVV